MQGAALMGGYLRLLPRGVRGEVLSKLSVQREAPVSLTELQVIVRRTVVPRTVHEQLPVDPAENQYDNRKEHPKKRSAQEDKSNQMREAHLCSLIRAC